MGKETSSIADIRRDYTLKTFDEKDAAAHPFEQFDQWWAEVIAAAIDESNAMALSTVGKDQRIHSRIVLLKDYDHQGFVFFTNYHSTKGQDLENNPGAALLFFWKELERQVRIEGRIEKISPAESDAYFFSRPAESRLGAWASPQSQAIASRQVLEENFTALHQQYPPDSFIPRPAHWGGYRLVPDYLEFWQGRSSRLHDRMAYALQANGEWKRERLAP